MTAVSLMHCARMDGACREKPNGLFCFRLWGGQSIAGQALKSKFIWNENEEFVSSDNATDSFGFSALPSGGNARFWSSTRETGQTVYVSLNVNSDNVESNASPPGVPTGFFSVRCISEQSDYSDTMTDARDGQVYRTVVIGSQTWMAENLNYESANSFCYNDSVENCEKYGRLYSWAIAMDSAGTWTTNGMGCGYKVACSPTYPVRGICPEGWHLPTKRNFEILFEETSAKYEPSILRSTSGWEQGENGRDTEGFSALPGGFRVNGDYSIDKAAYFWSSTELDSASAYDLNSYNSFVHDTRDKSEGLSVRCVKDEE